MNQAETIIRSALKQELRHRGITDFTKKFGLRDPTTETLMFAAERGVIKMLISPAGRKSLVTRVLQKANDLGLSAIAKQEGTDLVKFHFWLEGHK